MLKRVGWRGFTLVEIIFVISIIAILLAILLPGMSAIKLQARKTQDIANLKKIAEAWQIYADRYGQMPLPPNSSGTFFAMVLSGCNKNFIEGTNSGTPGGCILNDPNTYVSPGDKYSSAVQRENISRLTANGAWYYQQPWKRVSNELGSDAEILSYCVINCINPNFSRDTMPLAFSRGLKKNGLWDEKYGLYGSQGGFIIFCDGHVTWYDGDKPARFLKADRSGYTSDLTQVFPPTVTISCGCNIKSGIKGSDGSPLIIDELGTGK